MSGRVIVVSGGHPELSAGNAPRAAYALFKALRGDPDCTAIFVGGVQHAQHPHLARADTPVRAHAGRSDEYLLGVHGLDAFHLSSAAPRPGFWAAASRAFAALEPDVVLFSGLGELGVEFLRVARAAAPAARIIVTLDDPGLIRPGEDAGAGVTGHRPADLSLRARWLKAQLACADRIVATSDTLREQLADWGLPAGQVVVIPSAMAGAEQRDAYRALWDSAPTVVRQAEPVAQARRPRGRAKPA